MDESNYDAIDSDRKLMLVVTADQSEAARLPNSKRGIRMWNPYTPEQYLNEALFTEQRKDWSSFVWASSSGADRRLGDIQTDCLNI